MKKLLILLAILVTGSTFAYTIYYTKNVQVNEQVQVGNTVKTVDGLEVTLLSKEQGNLTYLALEETTTDKHTLAYTYNYTIIKSGTYDIEVSVIGDDVEIVNYTVSDTITIEIQLNQTKEFTQGQIIDVGFLFELVEETYNGFSVNNPFNPNTATEEEMMQLGLNSIEIDRTITQRNISSITDLNDWATRIMVAGFAQTYEQLVLDGYIVFE